MSCNVSTETTATGQLRQKTVIVRIGVQISVNDAECSSNKYQEGHYQYTHSPAVSISRSIFLEVLETTL